MRLTRHTPKGAALDLLRRYFESEMPSGQPWPDLLETYGEMPYAAFADEGDWSGQDEYWTAMSPQGILDAALDNFNDMTAEELLDYMPPDDHQIWLGAQ